MRYRTLKKQHRDWIDVTHWIPMPDIPKCPPHDFRNRGDGTAFCRDCGEHVDVTETGAAKRTRYRG